MCVIRVEGVVVVVVGGSVWTSCSVRSSLAGGGCCLGCLLKSIIFVRLGGINFAVFGRNGVEWDLYGGGRGSGLGFRADQERPGPRCSGHGRHSQTASGFEYYPLIGTWFGERGLLKFLRNNTKRGVSDDKATFNDGLC